MAVTNNFAASTLDLNGQVTINQPTALVWGADGRLYVTEADGDVRVLTVAFGDKNPSDANNTPQFYVTEAITLSLIKGAIQNHNDNGATNTGVNRQVTGIDVTRQFDAEGNPVMINGKPAVTIYVTSSDSRIGAGNNGGDINLDTNSGVITKLVQTGPNTWDAIDIVRGLPRSEENHATNGLEVIQEIDASGRLVSERMIVASGGNANSGAPSNNFAGQQEQPLSGALLEIDLTMISAMAVQTGANGRKFVYDLPTLNDPTRAGNPDNNDPFGGNDGFNSAKLVANGPVSIYSPGYRNAYDVEVTEDGRVWTYDNGGNNSWGGRPIGEAGDNGNTVDFVQAFGYIATNLNNGEGNSNDPINLVNWNPLNKDNFHEVTRSDDLAGRTLSAGQGGAQTFVHDGLTYVYGGHPNPTRAEGALAGLLFSPGTGANNAYLLVSTQDSYVGDGPAMSDYDAVIDWFETVEAANPKNGIYGVNPGDLTKKVLAVTPGVLYNIYAFADGSGAAVAVGASAPAGGTLLGQSGLPADIAQIVAYRTPIEGNYKEGGKTDGALDSGNGSINGLTEYTSTILDKNGIDMSGAIIAAQLNGGNLIIMGRNADGTMSSTTAGGFAIAADRTTLQTGAAPLGLASIGDDYLERGLSKAFQGSIWAASYSTTQPFIQVFQPNGTDVPLAGVAISSPTDRDLDGVNHLVDPFEFSLQNGYALQPGQEILIDFNPQNTNFPNTISATGLLGAALDGQTPNRDAQTAFEGFTGDQLLDGLYDIGGNILPGGNAPILQIKKVIAGTVVGEANTARDALHTGILPSADTDRIVATIEAKNWIPEKDGAVAAGQLTGMMFGDGTQSNFVRFVFGAVPDGQGVVTPGFEVGYEINDVYTALARVGVPALANAGVESVELRLTLDKANGFAVTAEYRLDGQTGFTALNLGGFVLPQGVLRDVLNGDHTIGSGASARESGAAIGFLAENAPGQTLDAVDFYSLRIQAFEDGTSGSGNAAEAFASQGDLFRGASYAPGAQGGAILKVMAGNNDIDSSNFGVNSFQVENIGGKKISAIFIDVTGALYPDTVFDPDGQGGDTAVKPWAVNTSGGTGGYVTGSGYFLPGQAPIPNSGGSGGASNGGFKGAMVKFNPTVDGGFQFGEVVGFSGDMDPNSIAGMTKFNVDSGAIQGWDVGGVSGHEMIGSRFTVLFDDGTTASGQLISDKSNSGSIAIAQQGLAQEQVSLVVNGTGAGGVGTYGGTTPSVIVSGDPGQLVRITMTRGFDPVTNTSNGIDALVSERLARYDFKVNNAYDEQSVDVVIGSNGTFDASALFTYGAASGTTKGGFTGDEGRLHRRHRRRHRLRGLRNRHRQRRHGAAWPGHGADLPQQRRRPGRERSARPGGADHLDPRRRDARRGRRRSRVPRQPQRPSLGSGDRHLQHGERLRRRAGRLHGRSQPDRHHPDGPDQCPDRHPDDRRCPVRRGGGLLRPDRGDACGGGAHRHKGERRRDDRGQRPGGRPGWRSRPHAHLRLAGGRRARCQGRPIGWPHVAAQRWLSDDNGRERPVQPRCPPGR